MMGILRRWGKYDICPPIYSVESCLTQARGLKWFYLCIHRCRGGSCLTQARGLKSFKSFSAQNFTNVVPHAGTWIEIPPSATIPSASRSCLTQARGLKSPSRTRGTCRTVVPHAGTWIEMWQNDPSQMAHPVVPHAGTWIEMITCENTRHDIKSCLTQARGLKSVFRHVRVPVGCRASRRHVD